MELLRALGALSELPEREQVRLAALLELGSPPTRAAYTALFVLELPPYASLFLGAQGQLGGEARGRVAGFWDALGVQPPPEPDHVAALLSLYAAIADREAEQDVRGAAVLRHARRALFWEHLACWLPPYLTRAAELAEPPYRAWAEVLDRAVAAEAAELGPPSVPPLHFREAGEEVQAEEVEPQGLPEVLLAPVRSGVLLTRSDLTRMARALDVGARIGERRFVLRGLLGSAGREAVAWLGREAERQAGRFAAWPDALAPVRAFWQGRAQRTAELLARAAEGS